MDAELPVSATDNHTPMPEATDELRERLRVVLAENGVDEGPATLHSWRCEYPERYGKCDCVAELVTDLVAVVAEARTEAVIIVAQSAIEFIQERDSGLAIDLDEHFAQKFGAPDRELLDRAAALRGVGNQKVGVTVDDLALDEMDGNQNAEPRWSANRLEEVLREGLPDQNAEPCDYSPKLGERCVQPKGHGGIGHIVADQKGTEQ